MERMITLLPLLRRLAAPVLAVALLGGLAHSQQSRQMPEDVQAFHDEVRLASMHAPRLVAGEWHGRDTEVPRPAIELLKPNVMISREYENLRTGETVTFVIIQSRDARNMAHHYPPICYVVAGWQQLWDEPRDWQVADISVPLAEYGFREDRFDRDKQIIIANFMILPGTELARGMGPVYSRSADPFMRFYGAGQIQLIFDASTPLERRQAIFETFIEEHLTLIEQILHGVTL